MAHIVTCVYCKKKFDRDKFPFVQISQRRFAHRQCSEIESQKQKQEEKDKIELEEYIMKLFKEDYVNPTLCWEDPLEEEMAANSSILP